VDVLSKSDVLGDVLEAGRSLLREKQQNLELQACLHGSGVDGNSSYTIPNLHELRDSGKASGSSSMHIGNRVVEESSSSGGRGGTCVSHMVESTAESSAIRQEHGSDLSEDAASPSYIESNISGPEDIVAHLPDALAVSSLTEEGLSGLKERLITLLSQNYEPAHDPGWADSENAGERVLVAEDVDVDDNLDESAVER
jgi:hypothetical protein